MINVTPPSPIDPVLMEMTRAEILMLVGVVAQIDIDAAREWKRRLDQEDAFGCMLDPTRWMQQKSGREVSLRILNAFIAFRAALEPEKR